MKKFTLTAALATLAGSFMSGPALAASKNPFSAEFWTLSNTDFIVSVSFILFLAVLAYFKVPGMVNKMLDERATGIQSELDEAASLREEAQSLLASYERKQKEVQGQADGIVKAARQEAEAAAEQAKVDLEKSIARRLAAAEDQIANAEASAVKEVRDEAAVIAVAAAREVIAKQMTAAEGNKLIDDAIDTVGAKLH